MTRSYLGFIKRSVMPYIYSSLSQNKLMHRPLLVLWQWSMRDCMNELIRLSVHLSIHSSITLLCFMHISRQTAQGIDHKLNRCMHYGTPQGWWSFDHDPLISYHFLASDLLQFAHICTQTPERIELKFNEPTYYGPPAWLTNSTEFWLFPDLWLVKQFLCICRQTADWIELKFNGKMHYGPPWPD